MYLLYSFCHFLIFLYHLKKYGIPKFAANSTTILLQLHRIPHKYSKQGRSNACPLRQIIIKPEKWSAVKTTKTQMQSTFHSSLKIFEIILDDCDSTKCIKSLGTEQFINTARKEKGIKTTKSTK
ncbi:hypothetical protein WUBG_09757 [Wuchereria bancrofti]|uniref:Uncharacterized protein n=1 Tax=Wuchereria bancrofti TaxID=6293 RepID=J9EAY0_WUCBA|nr:hypothetical protein WUBG_09757 [Wuchereria bancrofti]